MLRAGLHLSHWIIPTLIEIFRSRISFTVPHFPPRMFRCCHKFTSRIFSRPGRIALLSRPISIITDRPENGLVCHLKSLLSLVDLGPHLIHGSLGLRVPPQTTPRSVQPFLQGSRSCPTDARTHTDRPRYEVYSNRRHIMLWIIVVQNINF